MVGIYARQSLDKKDSISIESQIDLCRQNFDDSDSYLVFQDRGYSGKNIERPGFQSMMDAVREGRIEKIVVYKLDRLSRNMLIYGQSWIIIMYSLHRYGNLLIHLHLWEKQWFLLF